MQKEERSQTSNALCPESSIQSANRRDFLGKAATSKNNPPACESTIESALRRDFIKKAVLVTAAIGAGGVLLGSDRVARSTARSDSPIFGSCCKPCGIGVGGSADGKNGHGVEGGSTGSCGVGVSGFSCGPGGKGVSGYNFAKSGCTSGVFGSACSPSGKGVYGVNFTQCGTTYGVFGQASSPNGRGVYGDNNAGSGAAYGIYGQTGSKCGTAVYGVNFSNSGSTFGVFGQVCSPCGVAVGGNNGAHSGPTTGVHGQVTSPSGAGVRGTSYADGGIGVLGVSCSGRAIPLVARGRAGQQANLQQWETYCSTPLSVVNKCGWFGIGTCSPNAKLSFGEYVGDSIFLYDAPTDKYGLAIRDCELRLFHGVGTSPHTSFGSYNGTCFNELMRLTNQGSLGVGTCAPNAVVEAVSFCLPAISGLQNSTTSCSVGVRGMVSSTSPGSGSMAVLGENKATGGCGVGVYGSQNGSGWGVFGTTPNGFGVYGFSDAGQGVVGFSGGSTGVIGESLAVEGVGVAGIAGNAGAIPFLAKGAAGQTADLMQFENSCGTMLSVVNKCGSLAVGAASAPTTLTIGGSMSAKTVSESKNYKMKTTDFAVLGSASATAGITITLPKANTASGMIVFVKKVDSNKQPVTVAGSGKDTIEGVPSKNLTKQYDSLQLISNGSNEWLVLGNSICAAFTS